MSASGGAIRGARALASDVDAAAVLASFDKDGDGTIDTQEMKDISEKEMQRREAVERALRRALDREDALKKEYDEWSRTVEEEQEMAGRETHPILQALDKDHDGGVGIEELSAATSLTEDQLDHARRKMLDSIELPRIRLRPELLEYPAHLAQRREQGMHTESLNEVRAMLHSLERRIREEQDGPPPQGALRSTFLKSLAAAVRKFLEHMVDVERHCTSRGVDASAPADAPIPGPTPIEGLRGLAEALGNHAQRFSQLHLRLESIEADRETVLSAMAELATTRALGEMDEPPPQRPPERSGAKGIGWDRLWEGKRRAECAHVQKAAQQHWDEITQDLDLGQKHIDALEQEQKLLREAGRVVGEVSSAAADSQKATDAVWAQVRTMVAAYRATPQEALTLCDRDDSLLKAERGDATAKDKAARQQFRRAHGKGADWYQSSRQDEQRLHDEIVKLRDHHHAKVSVLTAELKQLHEEKTAEEQRLMAASLQYFRGVEDRQRSLVGQLEELQVAFKQQSRNLRERLREAREHRRARERQESETLGSAIQSEQQRRVRHFLTLEKIDGLRDKVASLRPHFEAAVALATRCEGLADAQRDFLHESSRAELPRVRDRETQYLEQLHGSLGSSYLHLAQLVYKNGLRQSEALAQKTLVEQQLEFCRDTWDPLEKTHTNELQALDRRLEEVRIADESWQLRMRALLKEQRAVGDALVSRGLLHPGDAKSQLGTLFQQQRAVQHQRCAAEGVLAIEGSPNASAPAAGSPSPVRMWQERHDQLAEQSRVAEDVATQEQLRTLMLQRADPERERIERLRLAASSTAAHSRTQHVARRQLKRHRRATVPARGAKQKPARTEVSAAVIRLDFPEVTDDDAINLPNEPPRLDEGDVRVKRLLEFDVDTPIQPPPPPPSSAPPAHTAPVGSVGRAGAYAVQQRAEAEDGDRYDTRTVARLEEELVQLMKSGQVGAPLARKRQELIQYLCTCLEAARQADDKFLIGRLQGHLQAYGV